MENEGLAGLRAAFAEWRSASGKPFRSWLMKRTQEEARRYGPAEVSRATGTARSRPKAGGRARRRRRTPLTSGPGYSRVTLAAPGGTIQPVAEIEGLTGLKVRLFTPAGEALRVLSSLVNAGGRGDSGAPNANVVVMHEAVSFRNGVVFRPAQGAANRPVIVAAK